MKAVILAAGMGTRLRPITNEKPKALVEVKQRPIISYILDNLYNVDVKDIVLCIGYKAIKVMEYCDKMYSHLNITYVENKNYNKTNNMYSLYLAQDYLNEDILLMNGDVIFDSIIIKGLIKENISTVAVDRKSYFKESMKLIVKDNLITGISKGFTARDSYGCSIDVYKILEKDLDLIKKELYNIIEIQKNYNEWTEVVLNNLFNKGELIAKPYDIGNAKWIEIDNIADLAF